MEQIQQLALERISCDPQVRSTFDDEGIASLAQTMAEAGQQNPILLRRDGDRLVIVEGERRYRAAKRLGWKSLSAVVVEKELSAAAIKQRQIICNCQREDLSPVDLATAVQALLAQSGWSATEAAARLGFSNAKVSRLMTLATAPAEIQERVRKGELPMTAACELAHVADIGEREKLADQVAKGELTRDALSGRVKRKRSRPNAAAPAAPARVTAKLGEGRSVTVCAGGMTLETFISVLEELLAKARQARPKGLALDTFLKILLDQSKTVQ